MNLRSVGALLAISAALSCATAINQEAGLEPLPMAGSDSGGGAGLGEEGGAPAGGAPQAGAPGSAGKGDAGKGGTTGTAGKGGGGTGGKGGTGGGGGKGGAGGRGGSGGTVGVAGSNVGGKAGTGSSGAGGGSAGGGSTGPCQNPVDLPSGANGNSGNFGSTGPACFRTKSTFNNVGCSNFEGRTLKVNDVVVACPALSATFAPAIDGWTYFEASGGPNVSASFYWYTS